MCTAGQEEQVGSMCDVSKTYVTIFSTLSQLCRLSLLPRGRCMYVVGALCSAVCLTTMPSNVIPLHSIPKTIAPNGRDAEIFEYCTWSFLCCRRNKPRSRTWTFEALTFSDMPQKSCWLGLDTYCTSFTVRGNLRHLSYRQTYKVPGR